MSIRIRAAIVKDIQPVTAATIRAALDAIIQEHGEHIEVYRLDSEHGIRAMVGAEVERYLGTGPHVVVIR